MDKCFTQFVRNLIYRAMAHYDMFGEYTLVQILFLAFYTLLHLVTALQRQTPQPAPQLTVIAHSTCCSVAPHVPPVTFHAPPVNPQCPNVAQNKISTVSNNRLSRRKPEKLDLKSAKIQIQSNLRTELSGAMSSFSNLVITVLGLHLLACLLVGRFGHRKIIVIIIIIILLLLLLLLSS